MRRKKLKPTLHNIYKSQKYQPKVILHRLSKSVLDNYINTVYEPCFEKPEEETSTEPSFNVCETLSGTIDTVEDKVTLNKSSQSPLKHKMPFTVKATNTMNDKKSGSTIGKNRILPSSVKYRSSLFLSPQRSQKSVKIKSHLTSVKNLISPGTRKPSKLKSPTSILKYTNKTAGSSNNKARNKMAANKEPIKATKAVKSSSEQFATPLQKARRPTTLQLGPDMVKDLNEILSTVEDAVIAENRLLSTVEDALLGEAPLTSPESSDHLEMGEISSELVNGIKKENIDMNVCSTKSKTVITEERMDRDTSIDEPSGKSSTATAFESEGFQNNSEHSLSGGEHSLPPSPRPWLTPKIVSVLSMAAQSAGDINDKISPNAAEKQKISKKILGSRSLLEISPTSLKQTFKSAKQSGVPKLSSALSLTDINSEEMQIINKLFKSKMKDSLSKLLRVVSHVSQVISLKECCGKKCVELQKVVNDLGIEDDLFSKLSIIIKDSVQESEHYNENAKYILQLINSYSRGEKESETPIQ